VLGLNNHEHTRNRILSILPRTNVADGHFQSLCKVRAQRRATLYVLKLHEIPQAPLALGSWA
jgi:hypothetical protein